MGEFAMYSGDRIKIGTCENLYYLRYDQRQLVRAIDGNVDPRQHNDQLRFRLPFPSEDHVPPGAFERPPSKPMYVAPPKDMDHSTVQFRAVPGWLVSLPCPLGSKRLADLRFGKNGWGGDIRLMFQRPCEGKLLLIAECMSCNSMYNYPTLDDALPVIEALENSDRGSLEFREGERELAARIRRGYTEGR